MNPVTVSSSEAAADVDVDVVASCEALRVVSGWLGMSAEEALREAGPSASSQATVPPKRPQFLGLGAKYLPHHKAVETATALDSKLRKRLERGLAARRVAEEEDREEGTGGAAKGSGSRTGRPAMPTKGVVAKGSAAGGRDADADDGSDGEERKATAVASRPGPGARAGGAAGAVGSKAAREAALLYAPVEGLGKKGKKGAKKQRLN